MKPFARERRGVCADRGAVPRAPLGLIQCPAERVYRRSVEKNPRHAGNDGIARPSLAQRDDGRAGGHGLERRDAEVLDAGENEAARRRKAIDGDNKHTLLPPLNPAGSNQAEHRECAPPAPPGQLGRRPRTRGSAPPQCRPIPTLSLLHEPALGRRACAVLLPLVHRSADGRGARGRRDVERLPV